LKTIISGYVEDNHKNWDKFLARAGCAIRSSTHEVTGMTPNFIMFGREHSFTELETSTTIVKSNDEHDPQCHAALLRRVYAEVQRRLKQAYRQSQVAWRRNYVISNAIIINHFTAKFAPKYIGPFVISKIVSPWTYELTDSTVRGQGVWHAKDLKAHPPDLED